MILYFVLVMLVVAVVIALVVPLMRESARQDPPDDAVSFYRRQLEIAEGDEAKLEVKRRLLRAANSTTFTLIHLSEQARKRMAALIGVGVSVLALGLYWMAGEPEIPAQPRALQSVEEQLEGASLATLVERMAEQMDASSNDVEGWSLLATMATNIGRDDLAAPAWRRLTQLEPDVFSHFLAFGEALTRLEEGVVPNEAEAVLAKAHELQPDHPAPRYLLGLAAYQAGRESEARAIWMALQADTPEDAPWAAPLALGLKQLGIEPSIQE